MKRSPLITVAVAGVVVLGGVLAATMLPRRKQTGQVVQPGQLPTKADPALGTVQVGVATGYAPVKYVTGGTIDYGYVPDGWSYAGIRKDW